MVIVGTDGLAVRLFRSRRTYAHKVLNRAGVGAYRPMHGVARYHGKNGWAAWLPRAAQRQAPARTGRRRFQPEGAPAATPCCGTARPAAGRGGTAANQPPAG